MTENNCNCIFNVIFHNLASAIALSFVVAVLSSSSRQGTWWKQNLLSPHFRKNTWSGGTFVSRETASLSLETVLLRGTATPILMQWEYLPWYTTVTYRGLKDKHTSTVTRFTPQKLQGCHTDVNFIMEMWKQELLKCSFRFFTCVPLFFFFYFSGWTIDTLFMHEPYGTLIHTSIRTVSSLWYIPKTRNIFKTGSGLHSQSL